jgi:hypothetical protein
MEIQNSVRRRKPVLSAHQKEIRFLTGLSIIVSLLCVAGIFWLVNREHF